MSGTTFFPGNTRFDVLKQILHAGHIGQVETAKKLGITKAACNLHYQRLIAEGFLQPYEMENIPGRGRPTQQWIIDKRNLTAGFVLERGLLLFELMHFSGEPFFRKRLELSQDCGIAEAERRIKEILSAPVVKENRVRFCFMGIPGQFSPEGILLSSPALPHLNGWAPDSFFKEQGFDSFSDTISLAVIRGETTKVPEGEIALVIEWSDGLGITFALNGAPILFPTDKILQAPRGLWDYSHMCIKPGGHRCRCGKAGCLEAYTGGAALLDRLSNPAVSSVEVFAEQVHSGNPEACRLFSEAIKILTPYLAHDMKLFGVTQVIFAGMMQKLFPFFKKQFLEELKKYDNPEDLENLSIVSGGIPSETMAHGAAATALARFLDPDQVGKYRGIAIKINQAKKN